MRVQNVIDNAKALNNINSINLQISSGGYVKADDGWRQIPLYAGFTRLYYVMDGEGAILSDTEKMKLEPGFVYLAPCHMKCGFYTDTSISKLFFHVNLPIFDDGTDAFENYGKFARLPMDVGRIEKMTDAYLGDDVAAHLWLKSEITSTVCAFLDQNRSSIRKNEEQRPLRDAMRYIRTHLSSALTVKKVAEAAFCSDSKLSALFRREVGSSVAVYIDDLIMSEAHNMLLSRDATIAEISEDLGFCDQFYFSRRFKKRFGLSPREYRDRVK